MTPTSKQKAESRRQKASPGWKESEVCRLPGVRTADCFLPSAFCLLLSAYCLLLSAFSFLPYCSESASATAVAASPRPTSEWMTPFFTQSRLYPAGLRPSGRMSRHAGWE
ncbi:MAG: hypothetical protein DMG27_08410 [Acidobacteria bacterium]|nr:MAG: hypothetical protein DMG27_08410 [Acidobacteriota bacterium]